MADYKEEAERIARGARAARGSRLSLAEVNAELAFAQVLATLHLAEKQDIANRIALLMVPSDNAEFSLRRMSLVQPIEKALGLGD